LTWITCMPLALKAVEFAYEVAKGELKKPADTSTAANKTQLKNYEAGNRAARNIIAKTLHPATVVALMYGQTEAVDAAQMWEKITTHFSLKTAAQKPTAVENFMSYTY